MGEPALLVEFDDGRLGVGTDLGGGSPRASEVCSGRRPVGPRLWLRPQLADVDVELAVDGARARHWYWRARGFWTGPPQRGQASRQRASGVRRYWGGGRRWPWAVIRAGLRPSPLRLGLGRPFGEGGGLALAGAAGGLVKLAAEPLVFGL